MNMANMQILYSAEPMMIHRAMIKRTIETNEEYKLFVDKDIPTNTYLVWIKFASGVYSDFRISFQELLEWIESSIARQNQTKIDWTKIYEIIAEHLVKPLNKWIITNGRSK
jgi:hypothetical protein